MSLIDEIVPLNEYLKDVPEVIVNKYREYLNELNGAIIAYESDFTRYTDSIALLDYFNRVRQINCTSTKSTNILRASNFLNNYCSENNSDNNFAVKISNYSAMYLSSYTMTIIFNAHQDKRYQTNPSKKTKEQFERIVETGLEIMNRIIGLNIDSQVRKIISDYIDSSRNLISFDSSSLLQKEDSPNFQTHKPTKATSIGDSGYVEKEKEKSSKGCFWLVILGISIIVRLVVYLADQ